MHFKQSHGHGFRRSIPRKDFPYAPDYVSFRFHVSKNNSGS